MLSLYRTLSLRYLKRRRARAALIVFSIAVGVAAWVATSALIHSLKREISLAATPLAGAADLYVTTGNGVPLELAEQVSHVSGVASVRPLIIHHVVLPDLLEKDGKPQSAVLLGGDPQESNSLGGADWGLKMEARRSATLDDLLIGAYVGEKLEAKLPLDEQGRFNVVVGGKPHRLRAVGVLNASGPAATLGGNVIAMRLPAAAIVRGRPGLATRLEVTLERDV